LCQILNPAKMQKIPEIPRFTTFQALKFTHSIPRRPLISAAIRSNEAAPAPQAVAGERQERRTACAELNDPLLMTFFLLS
jgi:hypothetical protein